MKVFENMAQDDTFLSDKILLRAIFYLYKNVDIDNTKDIPYLAGYSNDGKKFYIDRHLPQYLNYKNKDFDVYLFLVIHELVEKALENSYNIPYQYAHQLALRNEKESIEASGLDWNVYDEFMRKYIKLAGNENLINVPSDLDLKPYEDELDFDTIKNMEK